MYCQDKEVCTESGEPEPVREYIQPDVKKLDGKVEPVFDDILPLVHSATSSIYHHHRHHCAISVV